MNDKQRETLKVILRDHARRNTINVETARRSLIDEGVYTEDGKLAPEYGGESVADE